MKKKFVKVMLFGALTLAAGASFVGCKDYDDDVKNLQEQLDKITSTSPVSSEDMKAAIVAAKAELQAEVDKLKASAADKTAITALETKIAELKAALEKADTDAAAKIAADLAKAQNDLKALIGGNTDRIAALETQIAKLGSIENRLKALEDAKSNYLQKGDLDAFTKTEDMAQLINSEIANALGDKGAIAAYVENAILTQAGIEATKLAEAIAGITGENGALTKLQDEFNKMMQGEGEQAGVLKRLSELETYKNGIDNAIKDSEGKYDDFADVLKHLKEVEDAYAALIVPADFTSRVNDALTASLSDANSEFSKLTAEVKKLGIDVDALKAMIQSVVFVPEYADGQVQFTSLYAQENDATAAWKAISKSDAVAAKFRISPASAAVKFLEKYTIAVDAQAIKTRAAAPFDIVETTVDEATGMVTIKLKANTAASYAVSLNIKSVASDKTDVATDVNSNYFPVISIENYLHSAYYKLTAANKTIIYNDATSKADYSTGEVFVKVSATEDSAPEEKEFSSLGVSNIFKTDFAVTNTNFFKFDTTAGVVVLKTYGQAGSVNEAGNVSATVKLTNTAFKMTEEAKTLGTVTVKKPSTGKDYDFGTKNVTWSNALITIAADKFDIIEICNANGITKNEYAALTATAVAGDVQFAVGASNALTATVVAAQAAGEYPIEVAFKNADESLTFKVTTTVKVVYPTVINLTPDKLFWSGSNEDGTVGLTPTLSDPTKPASIGLAYDLTKLFSNFTAVKNALPSGGSLVITVPDVATIPGLSYNTGTSTLTYDKDAFTGYLADGTTPAVVKVKAVVSLGSNVIQTLNATINISNISGTWVAPAKKTATLSDKAATVDLSKGFGWNDLRGKSMWADAESVTGEDDFAANTKALELYGLDEPRFVFFDKVTNSEVASDEYLTITSAGKISFTDRGKSYNFVNPYTITVKVVAHSQWGAISNYSGNEYITVTIPASNN